jgi:subtilisin family serine protease
MPAAQGPTIWIADGIYYAADNGAHIINMSLGGSATSTTLEDAVNYAYGKGVTVIAAAGNDDKSTPFYPAAYDNVIAVGATQYDETKAPYSNYGSWLDIVAPGGNIGVDQNNDGYADGVLQQTFGDTPVDWAYWFYQGTSMAAPHASGVAALLLARNPSLTPTQIRYALESTAKDLGDPGRDNTFGWGLIDARAALESVSPAVSISLTTGGLVEFGTVDLGQTTDSTGEKQTVTVDIGPVDLKIKSTVFADGTGNSWALGTTPGDNRVKWEFSPDGIAWMVFESAGAFYPLAGNVAEGGSQDFYFRITMPTVTASGEEFSATITVLAVAP